MSERAKANTKAELLARFQADRAAWRALLAEVGEARLEQPGPMGDWTFKDLIAHLDGWRERSVRRLEAGPGQEPATPWPASLTDDDVDEINHWIYEQNRTRPLREVLADSERLLDRQAAVVAALPEAEVVTPGRFTWLENGQALAEADLFGHLHEEHEPAIRAWLARQ